MEPTKPDYMHVRISATAFITVLETLYGPIEHLRCEWMGGSTHNEGHYDTQLSAVYKRGVSATGVDYEINLWDDYTYDESLARYASVEKAIQIASAITPYTATELPLTEINAKKSDVALESGLPNRDTNVWLFYGNLG